MIKIRRAGLSIVCVATMTALSGQAGTLPENILHYGNSSSHSASVTERFSMQGTAEALASEWCANYSNCNHIVGLDWQSWNEPNHYGFYTLYYKRDVYPTLTYSTNIIVHRHYLTCPEGSEYNTSTHECECVDSGDTVNNTTGLCYDRDRNNGDQCPNGGTNPIHLGVGNKVQQEVDFRGAGPFPLSVERTYNTFGNGWQFLPEVIPPGDFTGPFVVRHNGKKIPFGTDGSGGWMSDPDVTDTLESIADGQGTLTGWRYTTLDQEVEEYGASGTIVSITRPSGLNHTYSHTASTITVVHSNSGDELVYQLNSSGQITGFTTPGNETYTYSYDGVGNLTGITYPNSGGTRTYHYEDTNFPNALTGITDAEGDRYATWSYDTQGRAHSSSHGSGVDLHAIDYTYIDDGIDPRATVTNPLGKQTTYHFTNIYGVRKVVEVEGHQSTNCAAANKTYTYDTNGFIASRTDWEGNTTTYVRNAKGQELSRTEASGTAEARTITTEWHATFNLPTKIIEPGRETTITYDTNGNKLSRTMVELP